MARAETRSGTKLIAANRRARRNYEVLETVEAGMVLRGSEVKSLRSAHVQLADAYARIDDGEAWLVSMHIAPYDHAQMHSGHEPDRRRKLLLHKAEIDKLMGALSGTGLTVVPLQLYFKDGKAKVEIAVAKGKKAYDKRHTLRERQDRREAERAVGAVRRRVD